MPRIFNFAAGPGPLPDDVRRRIAAAFDVRPDFAPSVVEISHRGPVFGEIAERLHTGLRRLLNVGTDHEILLLSSGAQLQFAMLPMNLAAGRPAAYIVSGHWSQLAAAQAGSAAEVVVVGDGTDSRFTRLPDIGGIPDNAAYLHYCSNETVHGVQFPGLPASPVPLVADLSSEIFSRPFPFDQLGVAYACAQKNLGVAGLTLVVIRRDLLQRSPATLPPLLRYPTWSTTGSMPNTPCTFAWYVTLEVVEWIQRQGGLAAMGTRNAAKAERLYAAIERLALYRSPVDPGSRSTMNVPFRLADPALEPRFIAEAAQAGIVGIEGHRAVGGIRVSLYNAVTVEAVQHLIDFMADFAARHPVPA